MTARPGKETRENLSFTATALCLAGTASVVAPRCPTAVGFPQKTTETHPKDSHSTPKGYGPLIANIDPEVFLDRLKFWAVCGTICAAPSFFYAIEGKFDPRAMLAGTAFYIVLYAVVTAHPVYAGGIGNRRLGRRLRLAAKIRTILAAFGMVGIGMSEWSEVPAVPVIFTYLDLFPGILSVAIVSGLSGQEPDLAVGVGFGWTLLTTLIQGALVSLQFFVIGLLSLIFPDRRRGNRLSELQEAAPLRS